MWPSNAFVHLFTVDPADVDFQGHVSNVAIVRWLNEAAIAHSDAVGWDAAAYEAIGGWWVVRRHEVDYRQPARAGDAIAIHTWPVELRKATAKRQHVVVREEAGRSAVLAEGLNVWAFVSVASGNPLRIPPALQQVFDPGIFATPTVVPEGGASA